MTSTNLSKVGYDLGSLIKLFMLGEIALSDIQQPFIWKSAKVRNLFYSMYRGYPIGYFLFGQNALARKTREVGIQAKQK